MLGKCHWSDSWWSEGKEQRGSAEKCLEQVAVIERKDTGNTESSIWLKIHPMDV